MSYIFLKKAASQPDLKDFCEYLIGPLSIVEDILEKYHELPLNKKVSPENLEIYRKCDAILNKHLPRIVDTFCAFSFDYRHKEKILIDNELSLTAKEILLKNLSKIIEEIKLIEKEFNSNNSFEAVVQTKILSNYGYQPELVEGNVVQKESMTLQNKFNYDIFVKNKEEKNLKSTPVILNKRSEENSINPEVQEITNIIKQQDESLLIQKEPIDEDTEENISTILNSEVGGGTVLFYFSFMIVFLYLIANYA